ncbi:MAG: 16S rRNA (cytosine(1402)-N(4))-methyltransferase RsmH [Patescibacteria group bacterium]|jgi:16S rRNA (cytosine1402-N4)-methyltransferase
MHIPVLAKEVLEGLALRPGETVIDGTLGGGGHAALMLAATAPSGRLIGFDRDARNLEIACDGMKGSSDRVTYVHDSFGNMVAHVEKADAILFDLGFSSMHVDDATRGFSFMKDGPLDMRYDASKGETAADIVNGAPREEIAAMLRIYSEEPFANQIAKAITDKRKEKKFATTLELADFIASLSKGRGKIHPATRTFQALRIAVNDELGELERGLKAAEQILNPGGRIAIITFHSLEDRMVKNFFKDSAVLKGTTKKPIEASEEEIRTNPRSRSAKLRIAVRA